MRVFLEVGELADHQALDLAEDAAQAEVVQHAVDGVRALAHVFYKEDAGLVGAEGEGCTLQAAHHGQVAAAEQRFGFAGTVQRVRRDFVVERLACEEGAKGFAGGFVLAELGQVLGHGGVDRGDVVLTEHQVQGGDVGETDHAGLVGGNDQLVEDLHHAVAAAGTEDVADVGVLEGLVQVFGAAAFGAAEAADGLAGVLTFGDAKTPGFQALAGAVQVVRLDAAGGHHYVYSLFHNQLKFFDCGCKGTAFL